MSPGVIDKQDRELLANALSDWLEQQGFGINLRAGVNTQGEFYEIDIWRKGDKFAVLVIDHYDDIFMHDTRETVDYFDPEFFSKLLNLITQKEIEYETKIRR